MLIYLCLFLPPLIVGATLILKVKPDGELINKHPQIAVFTWTAILSPILILFMMNLARFLESSHTLRPDASMEISGLVALGLLSISWGCLALGLASAYFRK